MWRRCSANSGRWTASQLVTDFYPISADGLKDIFLVKWTLHIARCREACFQVNAMRSIMPTISAEGVLGSSTSFPFRRRLLITHLTSHSNIHGKKHKQTERTRRNGLEAWFWSRWILREAHDSCSNHGIFVTSLPNWPFQHSLFVVQVHHSSLLDWLFLAHLYLRYTLIHLQLSPVYLSIPPCCVAVPHILSLPFYFFSMPPLSQNS